MENTIIKTLAFFFVAAMVYYFISILTKTNTNTKETFQNNSPSSFTLYGATSNAANYTEKMTKYNAQLKNTLLIPTYRKQYETTVQTLEEIVGYMMVEVLLSIDTKNMTRQQIVDELNKVNILADAQRNLVNSVLPFIDSQ
jgi:hypothetical protein